MTLLGILVPALLVVLALRRWFAPVPWSVAAMAMALTPRVSARGGLHEEDSGAGR
jgi:hypothetical protein